MKKNGFFNLHTFPDSVIFAMWLSLIHKNKTMLFHLKKNESLNFKTNY
jgi:hypothetical protein